MMKQMVRSGMISEPPSASHETLPRESESYLILDDAWRVLAANDTGALSDTDASGIVGQDAHVVLGTEVVDALRTSGTAEMTVEQEEYVLTATAFALPRGRMWVVRVQERESTLDHMVSVIVHEVRNPLSALRALVQGLEETLGGAEASLGYTRRIGDEIERLSRLLSSMAQVAGPHSRPPVLLPPGQILERAASVYRPELARRGIALQVHVTPRALPIRAEADQIQQMLVNLIANALDAMPHGGTLTLRARLDPRGRPVLQVEDTGSGMTTEQQGRALRPRASTKPGGMGLGLMVVRSIVRAHQGRLRITSEPGKGTLVSVTFPAPPNEWEA